MNIAFGFDIFYPEKNGIITTTIELARNLVASGHKVYFFVPDNGVIDGDEIEYGIKVVKIKGKDSSLYAGMKHFKKDMNLFTTKLKENNIDIVHTLSPGDMGVAISKAANILNIPTISTHHTMVDNKDYIRYALKLRGLSWFASLFAFPLIFNRLYNKTWTITAPSLTTVKGIKKHLKKRDVRYISNGINLDLFTNKTNEDIVDKNFVNDKTIICVGRVGFEKGIDTLVKGFNLALKKDKDLRLIIVGNGPYMNGLKKLVKKLNIEQNILITGSISNVLLLKSNLYDKAYLFATASLSENQSMSIIEALCSGLPVLCANQGNQTDLVNSENGWIFKPNDIEDLAKVLLEAINDKKARAEKSQYKEKALDMYCGATVTKEFIKVYEELVKYNKQGMTLKSYKKYFKQK